MYDSQIFKRDPGKNCLVNCDGTIDRQAATQASHAAELLLYKNLKNIYTKKKQKLSELDYSL